MVAEAPDIRFFESPILNSPYAQPTQHWALEAGQPTGDISPGRRGAEFFTPIPKPGTQPTAQQELILDEGRGLSSADQQYQAVAANVTNIRREVDAWRALPNEKDWGVTPETARLLQHWRDHKFSSIRPFFCQLEAVETIIWLTEVAPRRGQRLLDRIADANREANPNLVRYALKMATGAGKTTVMAMIIAWQTINAVRHPQRRRFTRGFLVVAPGITIKDRLRVLQPNDPDSYYQSRELVPTDMLPDLGKARIVITNFHAFKLREAMEVSRGGRRLLQGRGPVLTTTETDGQMIQRVMPELMGIRNILALNDEGHHCYRRKPGDADEGKLSGEERSEANANTEEARIWLSGLEIVQRKLGLQRVIDLSATPFFLSGSGYREGTLFPWTVSDFSLMDAIECGIVKLPRVPIADNISDADMPKFRALWETIGSRMPRKGRGAGQNLDPLGIPVELQTAMQALYGHYEKSFELWRKAEIAVPPCFIIVCNNTATSKLVYDFVSGFYRDDDDPTTLQNGRLKLFRNFDDNGEPLARPNTLLIDSKQLDSGEALDREFRKAAADEIERFRRERLQRSGNQVDAAKITEQDLLREVMNTVGKPDTLGASIRCVVSVSMLTEGWDANTVTHVLGVRAFGTQLLCEQVVGRALRRQSYDLNEDDLFNVEYADVLGVPFDFTAKPVVAAPQEPRRTVQVKAMRPERDHLEIRFPRVQGYRVELPKEELSANFNDDSVLRLTPQLTGPTITRNAGIIGDAIDLTVDHLNDVRHQTVVMHLTKHLLFTTWRDPDGDPELHLYGKLKRITADWLDDYLICDDDTYPAQLMYQELADRACNHITAAITRAHALDRPVRAMVDPYNPLGSTAQVNFTTSKEHRSLTNPDKCHINWAIFDLGWEEAFWRILESEPRVQAYVKNHNLGFEVPYRLGSGTHMYIPDFIVKLDDGHDDLLNLIVEIKGYRGEDAKVKKETMDTYWIPGVNNLGRFGRWKFAEFTSLSSMKDDFADLITRVTADA